MQQIQIPDRLYKDAQKRASDAGFESVDEFVTDVVTQAIGDHADNFDHLFTPERLKRLSKISAELDAGGKSYTLQDVDQHFVEKREAWLRDHAS